MSFRILLCAGAFTLMCSCNRHNLLQQANANVEEKNIFQANGEAVNELSNAIMVIYQDKKNNYWFGSRGQGVYRYDGKQLLHFTMKHGLISNDIWGIQEDKAGNIYFDTQEGVSKFDGQDFSTLQISDSSGEEWKGIT